MKITAPRTVPYNLSVDPGLGGTGYAVWEFSSLWEEKIPPVDFGVHTATKGNWIQRANIIMRKFDATMVTYRPKKVYVEFPQFFESASGIASAAGRQAGEPSPLHKLLYVVGCIGHSCMIYHAEFVPVDVNTWKGQLSKDAVCARIARRLNCSPIAFGDHAADACGLGLYVKGCF